MANNREKGHRFERTIAKKFRSLGFSFCKTSREVSRLLDSCKIDLANLPINIQVKSGYKKARPKGDEIFKEMKECLIKNFPKDNPIHTYPKVLIHKLDERSEENVLVTMSYTDWEKLFKAYCTTL